MTVKQIEQLDKGKQYLNKLLAKSPYIAVTGRVESWLKDSEYRYPVSCTMMRVKDSMEADQGIEYSWLYVSKALRYGAGVVVDLSELRPSGAEVGKGGTSAGPVPFLKNYSTINETLRRGGAYKNGAVVANLNIGHPDAKAFINASPREIPWLKRTLYVSDMKGTRNYLMDSPLLDDVIKAVAAGTLWLAKIQYDKEDKRIYSNVCNGILLPSRGTCLLSHVNLGLCTIKQIPLAFERGMRFLCKLHKLTGAGRDNYYLTPKQDKQVGLGVLGLANLLSRYRVTYAEFTTALEYRQGKGLGIELALSKQALLIVDALISGFERASKVALNNKMQRAFTVEPTASVSFRNRDTHGWTTAAEISPPICHEETKATTRDSETFGPMVYHYPPTVETAQQVGWDVYYRLCKAWQMMMDSTGLSHSISFNIWNTQPINKEFLEDWLNSPLITTYYRMMVEQDYADKSSITAMLSDANSTHFDNDFFAPVDSGKEEAQQFSFITPSNDVNFCSACAE